MQTSLDFLDAVKQKYGITSDYQLSGLLNTTRSCVSRYRVGKDFLGEETAVKVATLLDLDPAYVMICIASERAKKPEVKAAWQHAAQVLYAAILTVLAILPGLNADNLSGLNSASLYIMTNAVRYWYLTVPLLLLLAGAFPHNNARSNN